MLAASQTRDKEALTKEGVEKVLAELADMGFEYIVCDSPAGIETGALMAMHFADEALVVTNPEVSSVRDSDRILGMLASKTKRAIQGGEPIKEHLLITRYNTQRVHQGEMLSLDDIQDILRIQLIGVIPESETVLQASNQGVPAVHMKGSDVSEAYKDMVARFLGEEKPLRFVNGYKPSFFKRLFGRKVTTDGLVALFPARRKKTSATVAKERLQIILAHERTGRRRHAGYLSSLQRDLVDVICKYIKIDPKDIKVNLERQENLEVLEVKIELPEGFEEVAQEDNSCAIAAWGFASILMINPLAGQGASPKDAEAAQAAIDKGRAWARRPSASATTSRRSPRTTRTSPSAPSGAPGRARQGLRGARREISEGRRGADLLRAVPRRHATADRPDLRRVPQGGEDPGRTVQEAPAAPRRRALPDPQLRRAADREAGHAGGAALRRDRARRAARAAHALAHLHARGRMGRLGGDQPALGRRRRRRATSTTRRRTRSTTRSTRTCSSLATARRARPPSEALG